MNERDYLFAKKKYVLESENLAQKLSELSGLKIINNEEYADFEILFSEIIHVLISRIVFFGGKQMEITFCFCRPNTGMVELTESRREEVTRMY